MTPGPGFYAWTGVGKRTVVAAHKLPASLDAFLKGINTRINLLNAPWQIYDLSFEAHFSLLTLHPSGAGSGPLARLLMSYVQHYNHLPLSTIDPHHHLAYQRVLESSWQEQTVIPLLGFLHKELLLFLEEGIFKSTCADWISKQELCQLLRAAVDNINLFFFTIVSFISTETLSPSDSK